MTTWAMCVGFGVAFFFGGAAIGWLIGWSVGFRTGTDDERARWSAWIVPKKPKDRP